MSSDVARPGRPRQHSDAALLDAALATFAHSSFPLVSMDAVAAEAGTTKATLYARFASKDALYQATFQREIDALLAHLFAAYQDVASLKGQDMIGPAMRATFDYFRNRPDAFALLFSLDGSPDGLSAIERVSEAVTERLAALVASVLARRGLDAPEGAHLLASGIVGIAAFLLRETQPPRSMDNDYACAVATELTRSAFAGFDPALLNR